MKKKALWELCSPASDNRYRKKLERKVDEITIAHGLGHQVMEFSSYVLNESNVSEKYKKYKRKIYYKPKQLNTLMSGYSIY